MTATDAALIELDERFEKLLLEHMDAWLEWAPRMRAARRKFNATGMLRRAYSIDLLNRSEGAS